MATPKDYSLSRGHLTGTDRNTFTNQRRHRLKSESRTMQLQMHLRELKDREIRAQKHNRALLRQFEEAQDTLREMVTLTAAMKTIRTEYERYLEENSARWQQQLQEKTQAVKQKRMEEYLRSCLRNAEERLTQSSADPPLPQGPADKPPNTAAPQNHCSQNGFSDCDRDASLNLQSMGPTWLTNPQPQGAAFPSTSSYQLQSSSPMLPSFHPPPVFQHPPPFLFSTTPTHQYHPHLQPPWPRQNPPGWASLQPDYTWSLAAAGALAGIPEASEALLGQLLTEVAQAVGVEAKKGEALSSKGESGGESSSSPASQGLDVKPVRLSSSRAESSESSRTSSRTSGEKRKRTEKRGRPQLTSSDKDRRSSQGSSSAIVVAAKISESDASAEEGRTSSSDSSGRQRSRSNRSGKGGLAMASPRAEQAIKERTVTDGEDSKSPEEKNGSACKESGSEREECSREEEEEGSPEDKSESSREVEPGSVNVKKAVAEGKDEVEKEESSSSEEKNSAGENSVVEEEEQGEKYLGDTGDIDDGRENEEERDVEDENDRKNTTGEKEVEDEEDEEEEEESEENGGVLKNDEGESEKSSHASFEEEEEEEEEAKDESQAEDEGDSDDSIISPQVNKPAEKLVIPNEVCDDEEGEDDEVEDEKGNKKGSSDDDFSDDDIEDLLAPQKPAQNKEEKVPGADEKPKAICNDVEIFQVEQDGSVKSAHQSDSDEFDGFFD